MKLPFLPKKLLAVTVSVKTKVAFPFNMYVIRYDDLILPSISGRSYVILAGLTRGVSVDDRSSSQPVTLNVEVVMAIAAPAGSIAAEHSTMSNATSCGWAVDWQDLEAQHSMQDDLHAGRRRCRA